MSQWIDIKHPDGRSERHVLTSAQVTIGSTSTSSIRIQGEPALLPQHILLAPSAERCWVSTASGAPVTTQDGQKIEGAYVDWGVKLRLGSLSLELQSEDSAANARIPGNKLASTVDKPGDSSKSLHPGIAVTLLITLLFGASQLATSDSAARAQLPQIQPELFSAPPEKCTSRNPLHRAIQAEEAGLAKSERYVFAPQDGITAVELLQEAEACYRAASMSSDVARVSDLNKGMRHALEQDFKLLQLRLSRALETDSPHLALAPIHTLLALMRHKPESDYALALHRLAVRLSTKD